MAGKQPEPEVKYVSDDALLDSILERLATVEQELADLKVKIGGHIGVNLR